jgi:hypothetical protein
MTIGTTSSPLPTHPNSGGQFSHLPYGPERHLPRDLDISLSLDRPLARRHRWLLSVRDYRDQQITVSVPDVLRNDLGTPLTILVV